MAPLPMLLLALLVAAAGAEAARPELAARLRAEATIQCWEALMELRSCTGEVVLFFLNGETYLGPSCCRAIQVIQKQCWAADAMLIALGFTAQEGFVLRGFCDAAAEQTAPAALPPPRSPPSTASPSPVPV
ncbi:Egg cell-secreted protein 1.1 [Platanthera guangdongensis]|uniref:Egg cell-secreted protein 1.1 n=1 Tax=Platanthera guangdongensis TaxID=2320717 RepID=A0ABR2M2H8_9ASPA